MKSFQKRAARRSSSSRTRRRRSRRSADRACVLDRGHLLYDGPVDGGADRVPAADRGVAVRGDRAGRRAGAGGCTREPVDRPRSGVASPGDRRALGRGGRVGVRLPAPPGAAAGSLRARRRLRQPVSGPSCCCRTCSRSHYWGFEKNIELFIAGAQIELPRAGVPAELGHFIVNDDFDLSDAPHPFDLAIASSLFRRLSLNSIAALLAGVVRGAGARWAVLRDLARQSGSAAVRADRAARRRPRPTATASRFTTASGCCRRSRRRSAVAPSVSTSDSHPRGESIMVITRRTNWHEKTRPAARTSIHRAPPRTRGGTRRGRDARRRAERHLRRVCGRARRLTPAHDPLSGGAAGLGRDAVAHRGDPRQQQLARHQALRRTRARLGARREASGHHRPRQATREVPRFVRRPRRSASTSPAISTPKAAWARRPAPASDRIEAAGIPFALNNVESRLRKARSVLRRGIRATTTRIRSTSCT